MPVAGRRVDGGQVMSNPTEPGPVTRRPAIVPTHAMVPVSPSVVSVTELPNRTHPGAPVGDDRVVIDVHAYVEVQDTEAGVAFYTSALGLTVRRRLTPRWVELAGARIPIFILGNRPDSFAAGDAEITRDFERHWTPVHLDFIVDELEPWIERVRGAGARVEREERYDTFRMANCSDPFGNGFDLIEIAPGGYDAIVALGLP